MSREPRLDRIAKRLPRRLVWLVEKSLPFTWMLWRDWRAGHQLSVAQDNTARIAPKTILLAMCLRNEAPRLPAFTDYYRRLGVTHFLIVDNGSSDGLMEWAREQNDVSVWRTEASYREAAFGMRWVNDLLRRHGTGHWCVVCDPDEFLVYPKMETRDLHALTGFLDEEKRPVMHALLIDAYSDRPLSETVLGRGSDPFQVCPYFDSDGYIQTPGWGGTTWIRGGPRLRVHFNDGRAWQAPALNKIPLVKWRWFYHYRNSMHDARPRRLNAPHAPGRVSLTGALFHFKFVSSFADKAKEEAERGEHWEGGVQYAQYRANSDPVLYADGISVRYAGPQQLIDLGLMSQATWF